MRILKEHLDTLQKQFDLDFNLKEATKVNNHLFIAPNRILEGARIINKTDPFFKLVVFFGKIYVLADPDTIPGWIEVLKDSSAEWFFNFGHLRKIDHILNEYDREIIDTHIYFLPDVDAEIVSESPDLVWFDRDAIVLMKDSFPYKNALCYSPTQPDYLAVAFPKNNGQPITDKNGNFIEGSVKGIAGASIDGKYVRQIGIDVDPDSRGEGVASTLVSVLKQRILKEGVLPFYGTSESHSVSRMVAIKSGFLPAYSELVVGKKENK